MKSLDGGRHWQRVTRRSSLSAVAAIDARQAWAVGPKGVITHTVDGGRHWLAQHSGTVRDLSDVIFVDAKHGWAAGEKIILRTSTGAGTGAGTT